MAASRAKVVVFLNDIHGFVTARDVWRRCSGGLHRLILSEVYVLLGWATRATLGSGEAL